MGNYDNFIRRVRKIYPPKKDKKEIVKETQKGKGK